jgi:hypothetical protein
MVMYPEETRAEAWERERRSVRREVAGQLREAADRLEADGRAEIALPGDRTLAVHAGEVGGSAYLEAEIQHREPEYVLAVYVDGEAVDERGAEYGTDATDSFAADLAAEYRSQNPDSDVRVVGEWR